MCKLFFQIVFLALENGIIEMEKSLKGDKNNE